ncbi:MAG: nucleoside phosphorylase [Candidatus Aureabacteria bacterium]|nr:nucleoside phosphorylase [Candidatus Auribacterota bacterium]
MSKKEYHIQMGKGDVGRYVLLPGDPGRVPKIAAYLQNAKQVAQNREYNTYTGEVDGIKVSVTSTGIGCPSAAIAVEELARIGADTFIRVGTAGTLQTDVGLGDLVISTATVRDDGTSRQYMPISIPAVPDFHLTMALWEASKKLGYKAHLGVTQTKDAFYTEEDDPALPRYEDIKLEWKAYQKSNVLASSMESAAIFSVAMIRKLRAAEILAIIGSTYSGEMIVKKVGIDEAIKTSIEAIRIIAASDKAGQ